MRASAKLQEYGIGELIDVVRESALDKKGESFTALDVGGRTILADTFAIVTGRSKVQTRAIADAIIEAVKANGSAPHASKDMPTVPGF